MEPVTAVDLSSSIMESHAQAGQNSVGHTAARRKNEREGLKISETSTSEVYGTQSGQETDDNSNVKTQHGGKHNVIAFSCALSQRERNAYKALGRR